MLFIIIHQAYELWFKQIIYEIDSIANIMAKPVNDNSPELQMVVHRLERINTILKLLVQQIDVLGTMTPMDFLDFRDLLRPASGFQSWQFKITEAKLGLKYEQRHGQEYYISQLREEHRSMIKEVENSPSLLELLNNWLERMPFFDEQENWKNFKSSFPETENMHVFWVEYKQIYINSLTENEKANDSHFSEMFFAEKNNSGLSAKASRAALFIMLYRGYPMLHLPYRLLDSLLEVDELLSTWRFRHVNMVHRMIGTRTGTGGSTGKDYLKGALDKHYIFKEIASLTSFLIERNNLPKLSSELEKKLGY
jgi:tryptophan 2,3-dioxygenase